MEPQPSHFPHSRRSYRLADAPLPPVVRPRPTPVTNGYSPEAPRKPHPCRFLPLPSISASPICTPTNSISAQSIPALMSSPLNTSESRSPDNFSLPPTWISTPPTPPPRTVRRSITCLTRPIFGISPSASFPASTPSSPHVDDVFLKRCLSLPSSLHPRPPPEVVPLPERPRRTRESCPNGVRAVSPSLQSVPVSFDNVEEGDVAVMKRARHIFHLPRDPSPDSEDTTSARVTASPEPEYSAEGSLSDFGPVWHSENAKDDLRKYHALKELLDTEVGYLLDLRALVTVYLRILPTIPSRPSISFSRSPSSFTSGTWGSSYSQPPPPFNVPSFVSSADPSITSYANTKDPTRSVSRYLFTDQEIEVLTRDAEEILQLHEDFVRELRAGIAPLGFHMDAKPGDSPRHPQNQENLGLIIRAVSTKFATEASRFASYESFCTGHLEALELVRKAQAQHPTEWEAFEQRCSSLVQELELTHSGDHETPELTGSSEESAVASAIPTLTKKRSRAASLTSIDGAVRTIRSRVNNTPTGISLSADVARKIPRLTFDDYLIKPVQRICKYPLMLDQLKTAKGVQSTFPLRQPSDVDVVVESATQAMRHVARAVDDARHHQDIAVRSALIVARISLANSITFQGLHQDSVPQSLTPGFLTSLGACLLAGSLDVIHCHMVKPTGNNVHVKYLGGFLYLGGYLILVKVLKGKVYEPKHWFSLADFEVFDDEEDDAMLPCSIRLISKEHQFELAAACQREKDAWVNAIHESRKHSPSWSHEPHSSLRLDGKGELIPSTLGDGPFELVNALPTIQSIPELLNSPEAPSTHSFFSAFGPEIKQKKATPAIDFTAWKQDPGPPSRRSSSASVKAIFYPTPSDAETYTLRRSSPSARLRVDLGLQDVISQLCLTARSYASSRDEELFQVPKSTRSGFVRSQSGISVAGMAKNRLTRTESVRITRRKSFVEGPDKLGRKSSSTGQCLSSGRRRGLSFTPLSTNDTSASVSSCSPVSPSPSPSPAVIKSGRQSLSRSPTILETSPSSSRSNEIKLKPSRSLVSNVKGFFFSRSNSSGSLSPSPEVSSTEPRPPQKPRRSGTLGHWARPRHRRARSVTDADEKSFTLPNIQKLPAIDFGAPISTPNMEPQMQVLPRLCNESPPLRKPRFSSSTLRSSHEMDPRLGSTKNISLLQRLKA